MAQVKIAVLNRSTVLSDGNVDAALPALQGQIHKDFAPVWGVDADLHFVGKTDPVPPGMWWLAIVDDPTIAEALGYHDLTDEGLPMGKVFAKLDMELGLEWTVTASHELLEMLGDPDVNLTAFQQTGGNSGIFYSYELCDPCEEDGQGYTIGKVRVSDFVYPEWFEGFRAPGSTQFDHRGLIDRPFKFLPGGYSLVLEIPSGLGWYQIQEPSSPAAKSRRLRPSVGSRRERRMAPRSQWAPSKRAA